MAYCVRCGVKLVQGSTVCPLCKTEVHAPKEIIGEPGVPLFPEDPLQSPIAHPLLDKNRKGIIELVVAFMVIAVITLIITGFALGNSFSPWLPIICVVLGGSYILVAIFVKPSYTCIASWYVGITIVLLLSIDLLSNVMLWPYYAIASVILYWLIGVFPWWVPKRKRKWGFGVSALAIAVFLIVLDALGGNDLTWSLLIALPTYGVVLFSLAFIPLRMRFGKPTITDLVLSIILSACWGVVAGDFFYLRMVASPRLLTWSSSVFIVGLGLFLFLTLKATLRRVRNYFNNRLV